MTAELLVLFRELLHARIWDIGCRYCGEYLKGGAVHAPDCLGQRCKALLDKLDASKKEDVAEPAPLAVYIDDRKMPSSCRHKLPCEHLQ